MELIVSTKDQEAEDDGPSGFMFQVDDEDPIELSNYQVSLIILTHMKETLESTLQRLVEKERLSHGDEEAGTSDAGAPQEDA